MSLTEHLKKEIEFMDELSDSFTGSSAKEISLLGKIATFKLQAMSMVKTIEEYNALQATGNEKVPASTKPPRHFTMNTKLEFGKHNGKTLKEIVREFPEYVTWMYDKFTNDTFDDEVLARAGVTLRPKPLDNTSMSPSTNDVPNVRSIPDDDLPF